jgi:hypothetical protein
MSPGGIRVLLLLLIVVIVTCGASSTTATCYTFTIGRLCETLGKVHDEASDYDQARRVLSSLMGVDLSTAVVARLTSRTLILDGHYTPLLLDELVTHLAEAHPYVSIIVSEPWSYMEDCDDEEEYEQLVVCPMVWTTSLVLSARMSQPDDDDALLPPLPPFRCTDTYTVDWSHDEMRQRWRCTHLAGNFDACRFHADTPPLCA